MLVASTPCYSLLPSTCAKWHFSTWLPVGLCSMENKFLGSNDRKIFPFLNIFHENWAQCSSHYGWAIIHRLLLLTAASHRSGTAVYQRADGVRQKNGEPWILCATESAACGRTGWRQQPGSTAKRGATTGHMASRQPACGSSCTSAFWRGSWTGRSLRVAQKEARSGNSCSGPTSSLRSTPWDTTYVWQPKWNNWESKTSTACGNAEKLSLKRKHLRSILESLLSAIIKNLSSTVRTCRRKLCFVLFFEWVGTEWLGTHSKNAGKAFRNNQSILRSLCPLCNHVKWLSINQTIFNFLWFVLTDQQFLRAWLIEQQEKIPFHLASDFLSKLSLHSAQPIPLLKSCKYR